MAFSQSIRKGQVPIICNLCETETKITSKCIDCDLMMCNKCCDKAHPKFKNAKDHKIVDIKDIGMYTQEMDFTNIKCQEHTGQNCCLFCDSCDQLICPLCISKTQNGHGLIEISKSYEIKLDKKKQYRDTKEKIQAQNKALKRTVDHFTERMEKELKHKISLHQNSTEKEQSTTNQLKKVNDKISTIEDTIKTQDASKVFIYSNELEQSISEEIELPELNINHIPIFCIGGITLEAFGSLQD
ncbi:unnamed protein product [Mytilus coruscus]|uniref:B box-type domain-containing protein n=1 Tax=Mytilus coruscus TaxID=42192 RepID=A0A6J8BJ33_MYTCO|nr:unnamed protein product [Mytilus coruscus]